MNESYLITITGFTNSPRKYLHQIRRQLYVVPDTFDKLIKYLMILLNIYSEHKFQEINQQKKVLKP